MKGPSDSEPMGVHYGIIPGCGKKPTLLQPGAQILGMTFGIYADPVETVVVDMPNGHREVRVKVAMRRQSDQQIVSYGFGSCSTMEGKYRYRKGDAVVTDRPVPKAYWDVRQSNPDEAQKLLGGKGFGTKKVDGQWFITEGSTEQVEHNNPADYYNTVAKIAFKRAYVHGTINATACSDIFTQDIEDMTDVLKGSTQFVDAGPAPYEQKEKKTDNPPQQEAQKPAEKRDENPDKIQEAPAEHKAPPEAAFLSEQAVKAVTDAFEKLSPVFNSDWLEHVVGYPSVEWTVEHRSKFMKLYKAINTRRLSLQDAKAALQCESPCIESLLEKVK